MDHSGQRVLIFVWIVEPSRHVSTRIKDAPYINVVISFDIEDKPRKAGKPPMSQTRQIQLMRVARRADTGILSDRAVGRFERLDEVECEVRSTLPRIIVDGARHVVMGLLARNDPLFRHIVPRARARSPSK